jgi:uncharacterized membrane protein
MVKGLSSLFSIWKVKLLYGFKKCKLIIVFLLGVSCVSALKARFGQESYDDSMEEITKLAQCGLLEDYKTQFKSLVNLWLT